MLLSIVIPTKNRFSTLIPVVKSILETLEGDYEVVIQDNSDDTDLLPTDILNNDKVSYYHHLGHLPVSDNTELAIGNATGKYILFIGDDDFVSPSVMEIISEMELKDIDNLTYDAGHYWWNTVEFSQVNYYHDKERLWIPQKVNKEINEKTSSLELEKYYSRGGVSIGSLPRVYHGITKKSVLEKIKKKTGHYVVGSCPDISLAISLALVIEKFHVMKWPVTLYGASRGSGGGMTASKSHYAKIDDIPFLRDGIKERWDKNIPELWSERTIYPQTAIEVHQMFGAMHHIDFYEMYAALFAYEPHLKHIWIEGYKKLTLKSKYRILIAKLAKKSIGQLYSKYKYKFRKLGYDVKTVSVKNISSYL
ncbi:glycosyltransferase family 2 protein [Shewanella sp. ENK2]|uniref:glycosyltransferase family 2 protein n=1 Tax=Shewanella sp. ENK2 TaxID=2775245 RepID=UPI0037495875